MAKGEVFPAEWRTYDDPQTGVAITQLTDHRAHSHHLYFTNPGWYDEGRRLLFGSDRGDQTNLYGIELATGEITQLTDFPRTAAQSTGTFQSTSTNPRRPEAYFWWQRQLTAIDLTTFDERVLYRIPDGFGGGGQTNVSADGTHVYLNINEDLSDRIRMDLGNGYVGFHEYWEARPLSRVVRVPTNGDEASVVFEDKTWIGHVNTSPTRPELLTFCHEGPWHKVDHRIWLLDVGSGQSWKVRPTAPDERVGHEYWFADGQHVGYHGWSTEGGPFHGAVRYDNNDRREFPLAQNSMHFHSNDLDLIVGDGNRDNPQLMLWRLAESGFEGPRVVLRHRGSFHTQAVHVHPRFSPDGRQILFTTDARGYGNPHLVDVPDFDALPEAEPS